jgi:uncharacterized protein (DUF305 family)
MKPRLLLCTAGLVALLPFAAAAQTQQQDHAEHHPGGTPPQTQSAPAIPPAAPPTTQAPVGPAAQGRMPMMQMGQMMQGMPEQCRAMMQQMMHGSMGAAISKPTQPANQSLVTKAYMDAVDRMHGPMLEGLRADDPDVAYIRGMIAHHQGALDMAKVALQYGKDDLTKKWAADVIRDQQREVTEMQEWLKKRALK